MPRVHGPPSRQIKQGKGGKPWPLQNQSKHLQRHQRVQDGPSPEKATAESYIYLLSNIMGKESLSQSNYIASKGIIKYIAEFEPWRPDVKLLLGHNVTQLHFMFGNLSVPEEETLFTTAVARVSSSHFALVMLCEGLLLVSRVKLRRRRIRSATKLFQAQEWRSGGTLQRVPVHRWFTLMFSAARE